MTNLRNHLPLLAALTLFGSAASLPAEEEKKEEKKPTIASITEGCVESPGLFNLYQNQKDGSVWMEIKTTQLDRDFIYFSHTVDGVPAVGTLRGGYGNEQIFQIRRHFGRVEFVAQNHSFYFDPESALSRASGANVTNAILASAPIEVEQKKRLLIKLDGILLSDALRPIAFTGEKHPGEPRFGLGKLNGDKTKYAALNNYKKNTAITVDYSFDNPNPAGTKDLGNDITDPRYLTVSIQHTFIAAPKNSYEPRFDDARVGYFTTQVTDQTTTDATPYRDLIHRWHLVKKKPGAKLSEPVKPITWWIENTTPIEYRDTIRDAVLKWNSSFEKAGFKNAVEVKIQPDDAEWDAGDISYNVLRWCSSPDPMFGGYGPSFVNPRTGQILGADIMLEHIFLTNRYRDASIYQGDPTAPLSDREMHASSCASGCLCSRADGLQASNILGRHYLRAAGATPQAEERLLHESLTSLILHEVGHTLGLNHNFKASTLNSPTQIHDQKRTSKIGMTSSVMDYEQINLHPIPERQGQFFTNAPGPYDDWAINFGYSEAFDESEEEAARLEGILARSTEPQLAFGNDADDMRAPGKGIDPRAMLYDLSSDPVTYGKGRCELARKLLDQIDETIPVEGDSYQALRIAYYILLRDQRSALNTAARHIGGVYSDRAVVGQKGAPEPFTPVPRDTQKAAMALIAKYGFAPDALQPPADLAQKLQMQRRGFEFFRLNDGEDPKVHDYALRAQSDVFAHLLHPNTQNRIVDSEQYGNAYPLAEVMRDLSDAVFPGANKEVPNSFSQNAQIAYVDRLLGIVSSNGSYLPAVQTVALAELQKIQREHEALQHARPHSAHLLYRINQGLDKD